ncbi:MAG: hypothetical protein DRJ66_00255 [Thermoprotei archaeon]|nr:MAG: hypothetical protein DRJ66_00255 [Thermoprotei archaeon]RLF20774.1 MAG: hypothetical protein DRZ82_01335 [Thermoprotei archaeon]
MREWPPLKRKGELIVALPSNVVSELPSLREKTEKLGEISRSLTIFRVTKLVLFRRRPDEEKLIRDILTYHITPPYLRKYIPLKKSLRYVGLLPPLRSPSHAVSKDINEAIDFSYRTGCVIEVDKKEGKIYFDIGLAQPAYVPLSEVRRRYRNGDVEMLRLIRRTKEGIEAKIINEGEVPIYWSYHLGKTYSSLQSLLSDMEDYLKIATSRYGVLITNIWNSLKKRLAKEKKVLVIFGGPKEGLYDIARDEGFDLEAKVDYVINFIPLQGTRTVRTEEAMFISLGILNVIIPR